MARVRRSTWSWHAVGSACRARVAVILGLTVAAIVLYAGVAIAALTVPTTSVPPLQVGTCLDGVHPGAVATSDVTRPVDCATAHDDEIVGVLSYAEPGAYPGQATVDAFANAPCVAAFSGYVGVDFELSTLDMMTVTPSELSWATRRSPDQLRCDHARRKSAHRFGQGFAALTGRRTRAPARRQPRSRWTEMTSLSVSIRLITRASCETEWTWIVAVTTAV